MLNFAASAATVNQCSVLVVNPYPDRPCVAGSVEGGASSMTAVCLPNSPAGAEPLGATSPTRSAMRSGALTESVGCRSGVVFGVNHGSAKARQFCRAGKRVVLVGCGPVFTRPKDLADSTLASHLLDGWHIAADAVEYVAVGFGSHHWSVEDGERRWSSPSMISTRRSTAPTNPQTPSSSGCGPPCTARVIADEGLDFVVAPVRAADDTVVRHVDDRFRRSVPVH